MDNRIEQLEKIVVAQQHLLNSLVKSDRFVFQRDIQMFEGRNIQLDTSNGTKLGTATTEKLAFWGKTPVVQPTAVANVVADLNDIVSSMNDLLAKLRTIGIIAS